MTEFNYSKALTRCMLISALALVAGVFLPVHHLIPFVAALAPLVWYHVAFLRPRAAEGLSQAAIDSVYYYGFLITVGALGATALDLSLHGIGDDFSPVAFQFGLGLLATGYAVWARVHLVGIAKQLDEDEIQHLITQQIARSRELVTSVELASSSFQSFAETLVSKTSEFSTRIEAQTQSAITDATNSFRDGVSAMTEQAQLALQELRGIVNDVTFGAEREQLKASVSSMVETVNALSSGLDTLTGSTKVGASSASEFAASLANVNKGASSASNELEKLGAEHGVVAKFREAVTAGGSSISELSAAARSTATTVSDLGGSSGLARDQLQKLNKALEKAVESAQSAEESTAALKALGNGSAESAKGMEALHAKLRELHSSLVNLNEGLIHSTGGLKDSMQETSDALDGTSRRLRETMEQITTRSATYQSSIAAE